VLSLLVVVLGIAVFVERALERRACKLTYATLIGKYAARYALDPYLVAAVIHIESGNDPTALSKSGAIGLMQVMPETGGWIAQKLSMDDFSEDMLCDPETNIAFGCWYLHFLLERYDTPVAIAAYNAGQGTVDKWLADVSVTQDGALVNIPYPETANYVKKVTHAYEKYRQLYKDAF
jgi:soluble lytic murein transglycosylase